MVGAIGSHFDLGSVCEGIPGLLGAGAKICSVGVPSVCAGEGVDIDVDSGAEASCLPASTGAETYPLHEMTLSMCGGHHVAVSTQDLSRCGWETVFFAHCGDAYFVRKASGSVLGI